MFDKKFPQFLDLLMGEDRQQRENTDKQIQEIIEKYSESVNEFYRLDEIRNRKRIMREAEVVELER